MRVLYSCTDNLSIKTKAFKAELIMDEDYSVIYDKSKRIELKSIQGIYLEKKYHIATMIRIEETVGVIYLMVPWLFTNIGSGFLVITRSKTKDLFTQMSRYLKIN